MKAVHIYISASIVGLLLIFINDKLAFAYSFLGALLLMTVQIHAISQSKFLSVITNTYAFKKIEDNNKFRAYLGLWIIASCFIGLLLKMVWLSHAL